MKKTIVLFLSAMMLTYEVFADEIKISDVGSEFSMYKKIKATKEIKQSINIGFSSLTGNTDTLNLNGEYTMTFMRPGYEEKPLQVMFNTSVYVTENNDVRDNEEYNAYFALEQSLENKCLTYLALQWQKNEFKNYDNKSSIGVGVGKKLFDDGSHIFKLRAGIAYNFQQHTNDQPDEEFFSFNQYMEYTNQLNDISDFYVKLGAFENVENFSDDYELLVVAGFNFAVGKDISIILQGEVNYDNLPPVGFEKTDTKTIVRVGYNF